MSSICLRWVDLIFDAAQLPQNGAPPDLQGVSGLGHSKDVEDGCDAAGEGDKDDCPDIDVDDEDVVEHHGNSLHNPDGQVEACRHQVPPPPMSQYGGGDSWI